MKIENVDTKIESHIKIVDVTDKKNPKTVISKRLFNEKTSKKMNINKIEDKPTQVEK